MAGGQTPWSQLLSTKRRRSKGDLSKLQARIWYGLNVVMTGIDDAMAADDPEEIRKWLHCLSQLSHTYIKATIDGDLERRLSLLESQALAAASNGQAKALF